MNPIPTITKGDVLDPKRFENVVNRLVAAQFFRDAGPARIFLLNVRKYVEATLRGSPDDYDVMSEHMKFLLRESWDEINLAYDPENGRVHPAFASRIEAQGLPPTRITLPWASAWKPCAAFWPRKGRIR